MVNTSKAKLFAMLFRGKGNTYVRNELPHEKPPRGEKTKTKITSERGSVDTDLILRHLEGEFGVGICPVCLDGKCYFGVIDIDYYGKKIRQVLRLLREYQLPLLPFRSKSGGLHLYLMLSKSVSAKEMVTLLGSISQVFCFEQLYGAGKVEIFPKQVKISEDGFGSAVTLPYFNAEDAYTYLLDLDGNPVPFDEALIYIQKHMTTADKLAEAMGNLPYSDAPPCIQRAILSGIVGEEDTGRNNFLFSYALYASKKYGEDFADYVREVNGTFACPLDEHDVDATVRQVKEKEYSYKCKDIPCSSLCMKGECRKREYGLGRDKGHFSEVEFGKLFRYAAAEPYYVWELRMSGSDAPYKKVMFRDEGELLDQKMFAKLCVRHLNFAPKQVQTNDWFATLNKYISSVEDIKVSSTSDTSETSVIRAMFVRYLANKQAKRDSAYQIRANLCVRQQYTREDGKRGAKYYFTHVGLTEYMRACRVSFDPTMLRETLLGFGAKEDVLCYKTVKGIDIRYPCWSKEEDEELEREFNGALEVDAMDKADSLPVTDTSVVEEESKEERYTEEEKAKAEGMLGVRNA